MTGATTAVPVGTWIHGTLRVEDLLPALLDLADAAVAGRGEDLRRVGAGRTGMIGRVGPEWDALMDLNAAVETLRFRVESEGYDPDAEPALWDLEAVTDILGELAPEGYYFGAHPGDAADFGFWPVDWL